MKHILFLLLLVASGKLVSAQVMAGKPQWVVIKSDNLRCWECKERLDRYLIKENNINMENGMLKWNYNLLNGEIKIQFLPDRVSVDDIKGAMNNAGFYADTTSPEPLAYKRLPPACKLVSEGGGPKKGAPCHIEPAN